MGKVKRAFYYVLLFTIIIMLAACADSSSSVSEANQAAYSDAIPQNAANKLTIEDIKKTHIIGEIINITQFNTDYALVEFVNWEYSDASRFTLFNLRTGDMDTLPLGCCKVKLSEIRSENEFVFFSDGTDTESGMRRFPFIIECRRNYENTGSDGDFSDYIIDRYFRIDEATDFGVKEYEVINDIKMTMDGIDILFGPAAGKEGWFYAAYTYIPRTKIIYNSDENQLIIKFEKTEVSQNVKKNLREMKEGNHYIKSFSFTKEGEDSIVKLNLTPLAKYYSAKVDRIIEYKETETIDKPFVSINFKNMLDW